MTFERDIHQTRVKNSSFGKQDFSVQAHSIYFFLFLFERASRDAGHQGVLFFKYLIFKRKKKVTSSITPKTRQKWVSNYISGYIYNKNKA